MSLLLILAAVAAQPSGDETDRFRQCAALARKDASAGVEAAQAWQVAGGDIPARQCLGLAYMAMDRAAPAAVVFEQAARAAEAVQDQRVTDLWGQAGNAWLVAGEAEKARAAFNTALAHGGGSDEWKGELYIDRARALVELAQPDAARADLDRALELVPDDPMGWLLSATLARRQNDIPRAALHIAKAEKRAPGDPHIALEAGNIAGLQGRLAEAREKWSVAANGDGPASTAAKAALDANPPGDVHQGNGTPQ